jgi:hypothetical protein
MLHLLIFGVSKPIYDPNQARLTQKVSWNGWKGYNIEPHIILHSGEGVWHKTCARKDSLIGTKDNM